MASIIYLDVDDEITTAAARIRTATDTKIALVLPPGSRLATSRINFRLLSREGLERNRVLSIVAADPAARAIAASAGLPVHATVAEFEAAIAPPVAPVPPVEPAPTAPGPTAPAAAAGSSPPRRSRKRGAGAAVAGAAAGADAAGTTEPQAAGLFDGSGEVPGPGETPAPSVRPAEAPTVTVPPPDVYAPPPSPYQPPRPEMPPETRARSSAATAQAVPPARSGRGMPGGIVAVLGSLLVVAVILGVIGWIVLPSASVVVTPVAVPIGPIDFVVRADPDATSVDADGGVIPATRLSRDFTASSEFESTGKRVVESKAKGTLRWTNCDPLAPHTIAAGTIARTGSGIGFATDAGVFLPVATISSTNNLTCQTRDVAARALKAGPAGNVGAGTIKVIPPILNSVVIKVTNLAAMKGGKREEFPQVSQKDVDAALAQLGKDLTTQFDQWAAAPEDLPEGTTAFPATGQLGTPVPTPDPTTLVGLEQATFQLAATATGTVVAVDTSQIDQVAAGRIAANVPAEHELKAGSAVSKHDGGQADGDLVDFRVTARAEAIPNLDTTALREQIKGKSVAEAKRILQRYGTVTISTWPGFVSSIPTLDTRLDLTVTGIDGGDGPASPTPVPSASAP